MCSAPVRSNGAFRAGDTAPRRRSADDGKDFLSRSARSRPVSDRRAMIQADPPIGRHPTLRAARCRAFDGVLPAHRDLSGRPGLNAPLGRDPLGASVLRSRRLRDELETQGHPVNRKRVQRLVRQMGLCALYPKPRTSQPAVGHTVYPYLLRGLSIERPNQVWATDICYIPMAHGFMYLVAIMSIGTRAAPAWRVSITDSDFCVEALEDALTRYGPPETSIRTKAPSSRPRRLRRCSRPMPCRSMDGKGCWVDNVFVERLWRSVKSRMCISMRTTHPPRSGT